MKTTLEAVYGEEVHRIGVLSDTHIPARAMFLPAALYRLFAGVQLILHAGDLVVEEVLSELQVLAPVEAVAGNMDPPSLQRRLGPLKLIRVGEAHIGMVHGHRLGRRPPPEALAGLFAPHCPAAIVFGHSHAPVNMRWRDTLFFNPGSAVEPRGKPAASCGLLHVTGERVEGEIYYLDEAELKGGAGW